ncbi:MAG: TylF/MycF/NovP-related O-methyltransferase [Chthoniobacteraceae bacterium]
MRFPALKELFSRIGAFVPRSVIHYLNGGLNYLHVGRWMHERGFQIPARVSGREEFYRAVFPHLSEPLDYLEFGVFDGKSMQQWSRLLTHAQSTLQGFDSFEGLPETWGIVCTKETFDVGGNIPVIDDTRVRFFKGWFNETLPPFLESFQPGGMLVVHLDADLFSSTSFVLGQLKPLLKPGTVLLFDEFFDREHETKAFAEFLDETGVQAKCLAATRALTQVAFRLESAPRA